MVEEAFSVIRHRPSTAISAPPSGARRPTRISADRSGGMITGRTEKEWGHTGVSRMQESLKYWLYQLAGSNVQNGQTSTTERVYIMTWYQKAILGATIGFGVLTALFMLIGLLKRIKAGKKA